MNTKRVALVAVSLLVLACGPTAQVTTRPDGRPTTAPAGSPPAGSTSAPSSVPTAVGEPTPIPLSTPPPPSDAAGPTGAPGSDVFQPVTGFPAADAYEVTAVTNTPNGFVAVGFGGLAGDGYFGVRQGIVWRSSDGLTWQETAEPAFQNVTPTQIAAVGNDLYVLGALASCPQIIEDECTDVPEAGNLMLRSANGGAWERLPMAPDLQYALLDGVIAFGDGLAMFGSSADDQETSTLWRSPDGTNWTPSTDLAGMDPISALAASPSGLVGFGTRYVEQIDDTELVAGASSDGVAFSAATVSSVSSAGIGDMAYGPSGFAAVGYAGSEVAQTTGLTMFSTDGAAWTQTGASDGSFAGMLLFDVHSSADGYVAVGFEPGAEDFTLQTGRAWVSADGQSWHLLGQFGDAFSQFGASALGSAGLVIFTADQEDVGDDVNVTSTINVFFAPAERLAL